MRYSKPSEKKALKQLYQDYIDIKKTNNQPIKPTTELFVCMIDRTDCLVDIRGRGCWFSDKDDVCEKNIRCPYKDFHIKNNLMTVAEALNEKESEW